MGCTRPRARSRRATVLGAVVVLAGALGAAPARAEVRTTAAPGPVVVPAVGAAPASPLNVSGLAGHVTAARVTLTGITHANGPDLDILLVAPSGASALLASDACQGAVSGLDVTFDDDAAAPLPALGCTSGTLRPANQDGSDPDTIAGAPSGPYGTSLAALDGGDPNGTWTLYVGDDTAGASGSIASWSLQLTTSVRLPGAGTQGIAETYPWTRTIPDQPGTYLRDVDVTLKGAVHQFAAEFEAVLQGPGDRAATLFSDACGNEALNGDLKLDDAASTPAPLFAAPACLTGGPFRPTDFLPAGDPAMPAPSPQNPAPDLTTYEGRPPGGDWRLFLADDAEGDVGSLDDWSLILRTSGPAPVSFVYPSVQAQEGRLASILVTRAGTEGVLGEASVAWRTTPGSAASGSDFSSQSGTITFARGQLDKELLVLVRDDGISGEGEERFGLALTSATGDAAITGTAPAAITIPADPVVDAPAPDPQTPTGRTPAGATPRVDSIVGLPSAKACLKRTKLRITFKRPKSARVAKVEAKVNGRLVRRQAGAAALRAIPVKKLRKAKRYSVVVRVTLSTKRTLRMKRVYRACAKG